MTGQCRLLPGKPGPSAKAPEQKAGRDHQPGGKACRPPGGAETIAPIRRAFRLRGRGAGRNGGKGNDRPISRRRRRDGFRSGNWRDGGWHSCGGGRLLWNLDRRHRAQIRCAGNEAHLLDGFGRLIGQARPLGPLSGSGRLNGVGARRIFDLSRRWKRGEDAQACSPPQRTLYCLHSARPDLGRGYGVRCKKVKHCPESVRRPVVSPGCRKSLLRVAPPSSLFPSPRICRR